MDLLDNISLENDSSEIVELCGLASDEIDGAHYIFHEDAAEAVNDIHAATKMQMDETYLYQCCFWMLEKKWVEGIVHKPEIKEEIVKKELNINLREWTLFLKDLLTFKYLISVVLLAFVTKNLYFIEKSLDQMWKCCLLVCKDYKHIHKELIRNKKEIDSELDKSNLPGAYTKLYQVVSKFARKWKDSKKKKEKEIQRLFTFMTCQIGSIWLLLTIKHYEIKGPDDSDDEFEDCDDDEDEDENSQVNSNEQPQNIGDEQLQNIGDEQPKMTE